MCVFGVDVGEQRPAAGIGFDQVAHAAHDHVAGKNSRLGAIGECEREGAPILDVDRIGFDECALIRPQTRRDVADVAGHARDAGHLAARFRLDLLEIKHRR